MAKGTIIQHLGNSEYSVNMELDYSWIDQRIRRLTGELDLPAYNEGITEAEAALVNAENAVADAFIAQNAAITAIYPSEDEKKAAIKKATKTVRESLEKKALAETKLTLLKADKLSKEQEISRLQQIPRVPAEVEAWSVDPADGAANQNGSPPTFPLHAGTVDVMIAHRDPDATYHIPSKMTPRDGGGGNLQKTLHTSSAAVAWNYAMQPGFIRWRPICRIATVVEKKPGIRLIVDLSPAAVDGISPQSEYVRQNCAVDYYCGSRCFKPGDSVVVFSPQGWDEAGTDIRGTVIGFANDPKKCLVIPCITWNPTGQPESGIRFGDEPSYIYTKSVSSISDGENHAYDEVIIHDAEYNYTTHTVSNGIQIDTIWETRIESIGSYGRVNTHTGNINSPIWLKITEKVTSSIDTIAYGEMPDSTQEVIYRNINTFIRDWRYDFDASNGGPGSPSYIGFDYLMDVIVDGRNESHAIAEYHQEDEDNWYVKIGKQVETQSLVSVDQTTMTISINTKRYEYTIQKIAGVRTVTPETLISDDTNQSMFQVADLKLPGSPNPFSIRTQESIEITALHYTMASGTGNIASC